MAPQVRKFGFVPDTSALRPGDLLLFWHLAPDWVSRLIVKAQIKGGYPTRDAGWTHAAVFLGYGDKICEADFDWTLDGPTAGVRIGGLGPYTGTSFLLARRYRYLEKDQEWLVALEAASQVGKHYGFRSIVRLALTAWQRGWYGRSKLAPFIVKSFYCSQLFAESVALVTGRYPQNRESGESSPAYLSMSPDLVDIPLRWSRIA